MYLLACACACVRGRILLSVLHTSDTTSYDAGGGHAGHRKTKKLFEQTKKKLSQNRVAERRNIVPLCKVMI